MYTAVTYTTTLMPLQDKHTGPYTPNEETTGRNKEFD